MPDTAKDTTEDLTSLVLSATRDLLDREDITIDDDFFSAGGDSVAAMHLVGHLARQTGLRLRTSLLFANPVLRDFVSQAERRAL
jgi:acyl carrier protein